MYQEEFRSYDEFNDGYISQDIFIKALSSHPKYRLGLHELRQVWSLAAYKGKGHLDQDEFSAAMHVIHKVSSGHRMPIKLPLDLIPLSHLSTNWADRNPFRPLATESTPEPTPTRAAVTVIPLSGEIVARVSDELWILILENLSMPSLRKACRASKRFHDLGIPLLYRNVNLSLHDHEPYQLVHGNYSPSKTFRSHGPSDDEIRQTLQRQCRFVLQLSRKPEYGSYVRSFKWTLGLENGHRPSRVLLPFWVQGSRFQWAPERVYEAFHLLSRVHSIDIGGTSTRYHHFPDLGPLFPTARRIRLRGNMDYALAWDILQGEHKASITSLSLHEVHLADYHASNVDTSSTITNMRRLFQIPSFRQRCRNIRSLFLCKLGQQHAIQKDIGVFLHDEEVYREWAKFISIVQPTNLVIVHSGLPHAPWNGRPPLPTCLVNVGAPQGPPPWPLLFPMNELFRDIVLPTLVAPWPRLLNLEIRGVQRGVLQGLINSLSNFRLRIDEELSYCWHAQGQYFG